MFRRFFQRDEPGEASGSQELDAAKQDALKQAQEILLAEREQDDGVHRQVIRSGGQPPPKDPDEQIYDMDKGEHAEIARRGLQAGDFKRSIYHLSLALASDPTREEWLALLDQWIAATGAGALDLVPLTDEHYFATIQASQQMMKIGNRPDHRMEVIPLVGKNYHARVAVHAYILAAQGRLKAAIALLLQLQQVMPGIFYVLWLTRWQDQAGFVDALQPPQIASLVIQILQKYPGSYVFAEQGRAEINRYLPLLHATYTALASRQMDEHVQTIGFVYAMALRKTGSFAEAVNIARALPATSYQVLVSRAMAEEASGNLDTSIATYREALKLQPDDVAVHNDIAALFLEQGNLTEALAYYERSIQLDPSDPYQRAQAYTAYLHYLQAPTANEWLESLAALAENQEAGARLLYNLRAPYIGRLPYPGEALINMLRGIQERRASGEEDLEAGTTFRIALSSLEAPSSQLALRMTLDAWDIACEIAVEETLSPDPRQPLRPVEYQVWRYEDMNPIPAVPAPDSSIAESIAALAQTPYALDRWYALARPLGQKLGPDALPSLLGVMVHPPAVPANWEAWDWLIAVQIASALTIASLETAWEGSRRKAALLSLIYGPMDWSGAAAIVALAVVARQDMRLHIEFDSICRDLWHFGPGSAEWPLERAMVFSLILLNAYSDESEQHISTYFEEIQRTREEEAETEEQ